MAQVLPPVLAHYSYSVIVYLFHNSEGGGRERDKGAAIHWLVEVRQRGCWPVTFDRLVCGCALWTLILTFCIYFQHILPPIHHINIHRIRLILQNLMLYTTSIIPNALYTQVSFVCNEDPRMKMKGKKEFPYSLILTISWFFISHWIHEIWQKYYNFNIWKVTIQKHC